MVAALAPAAAQVQAAAQVVAIELPSHLGLFAIKTAMALQQLAVAVAAAPPAPMDGGQPHPSQRQQMGRRSDY